MEEERKEMAKPGDMAEERRALKGICSRIGWALCLYFVISTVLASIVQVVLLLIPGYMDNMDLVWISTFVPQYLVGVPLALVVLSGEKGKRPEEHRLSFGKFLIVFIMCFCLMYGGSLLGNFLSALLSGGTANNALNVLAMDNSPLKVLFMVILAPLMEELVFRKFIIDRTAVFGEKRAVLLSALTFGMFHMNLYQFFYAFLLGWLFGYIYLRTGRLRYPVILHALVNFIGSVLGPMMLKAAEDVMWMADMDPAAMTEEMLVEMMDKLPALIGMSVYSLSVIGLSVAGLVLILVNRHKLLWKTAQREIPGISGKPVWVNSGMIVFLILCLAMTVLMLFLV